MKLFKESALAFEKRYEDYEVGEVPRWFNLAICEDMVQVDVVNGYATGY